MKKDVHDGQWSCRKFQTIFPYFEAYLLLCISFFLHSSDVRYRSWYIFIPISCHKTVRSLPSSFLPRFSEYHLYLRFLGAIRGATAGYEKIVQSPRRYSQTLFSRDILKQIVVTLRRTCRTVASNMERDGVERNVILKINVMEPSGT